MRDGREAKSSLQPQPRRTAHYVRILGLGRIFMKMEGDGDATHGSNEYRNTANDVYIYTSLRPC